MRESNYGRGEDRMLGETGRGGESESATGKGYGGRGDKNVKKIHKESNGQEEEMDGSGKLSIISICTRGGPYEAS